MTIAWVTEAERGIAIRKETRRPLFADFWSPTCLGCQKMDAVTYPQAEVSEALEEFVSLKLETTAWQPEYMSILQRAPLTWTPTFIITDGGGREVRRWSGFEPPRMFITELQLALSAIDRLHGRADQAADRLAPVADGDTPLAAEGLYWKGVCRFNQSGEKRDLLPEWDELMARYPGSVWAERANCLEPVRDGGRAFALDKP